MWHEVKELIDRKKKISTSIHDLFDNEYHGTTLDYVGDDRPSITQDEASEAKKKMKDRKATGIDEIPTKCLKALDTTLEILTDLFNKIYKNRHIQLHNYTKETKSTWNLRL